MKITKLIVNNFKSFGTLEFSNENNKKLNDVNILVGANASGKSNFIQIFEFLKEIKKSGIENTVKKKYKGINNIKNFNTNKKNIAIEIELSSYEKTFIRNLSEINDIYRERTKIEYKINLIQLPGNKFDIQEKITFYEKYITVNIETKEYVDLSSHHIYGIENNYGKFKLFTNNNDVKKFNLQEDEESFLDLSLPFPVTFIETLNSRYKDKSILEYEGVFIPADIFDFGIFDFEPKKQKGAKDDLNTTILDKTGEDLIPVIKQILQDEEKSEQFLAEISSMLDFIEKISIEEFGTKIDLQIKEKCNSISTESSLLSDGTITIIAIIVALYYQNHSVIFIEEPEHGIHPSLIADLIDMIYDVAESFDKQIIITTHSPEILRVNGKDRLKNLLLIEKKDCFSQIENPGDDKNEMVKAFLKNGLGVDTLFIQNLLGN